MGTLVRPLFEGALDVVGDIHGEIDALRALLVALGYNADGHHPQRRLVFVGDLCDRGPDSPAVIDVVRGLVERGRAQCILGNHELNLLRGERKHGNEWFFAPELDDAWRQRCVAFLRTLPIALERADLRVVHAAWQQASIDTLRRFDGTAVDAFAHYEAAARHALGDLAAAADAEKRAYKDALADPHWQPRLLESCGRFEEQKQNANPLRVATSGVERLARQPFWANGKWRMCDRVTWWEEYTEPTAVIFGHYWRGSGEGDDDVSGGKPDLFAGEKPDAWVGPNRNLFCVDFSVGGRHRERERGITAFTTRLGAVRWPERELVFDC